MQSPNKQRDCLTSHYSFEKNSICGGLSLTTLKIIITQNEKIYRIQVDNNFIRKQNRNNLSEMFVDFYLIIVMRKYVFIIIFVQFLNNCCREIFN